MGTTLKEAFSKKYPKYTKILGMYEEANGCAAEWGNITKPRLSAFVSYLNERLARTSVKTYCAMLKSVLNLYNEEVELPKGYESILSPKNDVSQQTWLTSKEIGKLLEYEPENNTERLVRNQFLMGIMTLARHSDYVDFTEKNLSGERLVYVSKKTHIQAEIPVSPALLRLLKENEEYGFTGKTVSDVYFNDTIRNICRKAKIKEKVKLYQGGKYVEGEKWKFVSSHTARRSGITNLYVLGADLYMISKMAGHASVTQTERYVCCGIRDIPEKVMNYFRQFK